MEKSEVFIKAKFNIPLWRGAHWLKGKLGEEFKESLEILDKNKI